MDDEKPWSRSPGNAQASSVRGKRHQRESDGGWRGLTSEKQWLLPKPKAELEWSHRGGFRKTPLPLIDPGLLIGQAQRKLSGPRDEQKENAQPGNVELGWGMGSGGTG